MAKDFVGLTVEECKAGDDDPRLGVHELSESEFCGRAFLILHENREPDVGREREINLDFEPAYYPMALQAELRMLRRLQRSVAIFGCAVLLIAVILALCGYEMVLWAALLSTVLCFGFAGVAQLRVRTLERILNGYDVATSFIPPETGDEILDVDWRSLLAAGFEPCRYEDALTDLDLKMGGKPWCFLRKGDLHIPVFYYRMRDPEGQKRVHRQHVVRMAAYCHLIQSQTGHVSPYGVLLFADSFEAKVLPNNDTAQETFLQAMLDARAVTRDAREGRNPEMPGHRFCSGCHYGLPVLCKRKPKPFLSNGKPLPLHRQPNLEGTEAYHSWCGDRFLETPPHAKAVELGTYRS